MHHLQECSFFQCWRPIDATGSTVTALALDSAFLNAGYKDLCIVIQIGNIAADSTALKLQECDTSAGSYTDVTGGAFTTVPLPLGTGGDNGIWLMFVDLTGNHKRYFKVVFTAGSGATLAAGLAIFGRPGVAPAVTAERGTDVKDQLIIN